MTQKKFSRFLLTFDENEDEIPFDFSVNERGSDSDNECDFFMSLTLSRNECSDVINEVETVLKNPELREIPKPKYLDGVEVIDSISSEKLNLDGVIGLDIHKGYVFCTIFFENKKELEEFASFLKSELHLQNNKMILEADKQPTLKTENQYIEYSAEWLEEKKNIEKNFKIFKGIMQDKPHTEIKADFQKIIDKIPLGDRANSNKLKLYGRFYKWISESTKISEDEIDVLFNQFHHDKYAFEKEDMNLIRFFIKLKQDFCSNQLFDEIVQEAKSKIIDIILKTKFRHYFLESQK